MFPRCVGDFTAVRKKYCSGHKFKILLYLKFKTKSKINPIIITISKCKWFSKLKCLFVHSKIKNLFFLFISIPQKKKKKKNSDKNFTVLPQLKSEMYLSSVDIKLMNKTRSKQVYVKDVFMYKIQTTLIFSINT